VASICYLRLQLSIDPDVYDLSELKKDMVVMTNKGLIQPSKQRVYIPTEYRNEINLRKLFPGIYIFLIETQLNGNFLLVVMVVDVIRKGIGYGM